MRLSFAELSSLTFLRLIMRDCDSASAPGNGLRILRLDKLKILFFYLYRATVSAKATNFYLKLRFLRLLAKAHYALFAAPVISEKFLLIFGVSFEE